MSSGMTNFIQGFLNTKLALDQFDADQAQRQAQLDQRNETLKLERDRLKGEQAHMQLQDQALQQQLTTALQQQHLKEQIGAQIPDLHPDLSPQQHQFLGAALQLGGIEGYQKAADFFRQQADQRLLNGAGPGGTVPPMPQSSPLVGQQGATGDAAPLANVGSTTAAPVSPVFAQKTQAIEQRLGMEPGSLTKIMHFETGGTFSPSVQNGAGSGATGLIQFMPTTAKALGTSTDELAKMSPEDQLDYVERYLTPFKGRIGNLQDAYAAVLNPSAIGKGSSYIMWRQGSPEYEMNKGLDKEGNGFIRVSDATAPVAASGFTPRGKLPTEQPSMVASGGAPSGGPSGGMPVPETMLSPQEQVQLRGLQQDQATLTETMRRLNALMPQMGSAQGRKDLEDRINQWC